MEKAMEFPNCKRCNVGTLLPLSDYGRDGAPMPARFRVGRARVRVVETLDQWYGPGYRYIKVMGNDRCLYILRVHDVKPHVDALVVAQAIA